MVSPITVIDETSNDDDEIILNLNLEMTIDDYDTDGRKNDALAEAAAAAEIATAKAASAKAAAEIAAVKAAAEIDAVKAAAEIAAAKAAAAKAAAEIDSLKDAFALADYYRRNIHVAGRIYPSAAPHLSLTVRDGKVTLAKSDDSDSNQQWYRLQQYTTQIKDVEGRPSITFYNNGTDLTLQHGIRNDYPVRLIKYNYPYDPDDRSVLWTMGDFSGALAAFPIRCVDDIRLELVTHNHNYQEGETIKIHKFRGANEHRYWKFTQWK